MFFLIAKYLATIIFCYDIVDVKVYITYNKVVLNYSIAFVKRNNRNQRRRKKLRINSCTIIIGGGRISLIIKPPNFIVCPALFNIVAMCMFILIYANCIYVYIAIAMQTIHMYILLNASIGTALSGLYSAVLLYTK